MTNDISSTTCAVVQRKSIQTRLHYAAENQLLYRNRDGHQIFRRWIIPTNRHLHSIAISLDDAISMKNKEVLL